MQNGSIKRSGKFGVSCVVLCLVNLSDDGFVTDDLRTNLLDEKKQVNYDLKENGVLTIHVNGSKENFSPGYMLCFSKSKT